MALELVYTSAEKGLRPGTSGFCTVAMTRGMPPALVPRLEALGGYRPGPSGDGPVAQCFWRIETAQGIAHVLSRVGPASPDHTQRTNKLATYLVLGSDELPAAGPAWLLRQPGVLREAWSGAPAWIEAPVTVPKSPRTGPRECVAWARACGDAGWAGVAASAFLRDQSKPVHLVVPESLDALELVDEVHALLPDWARWRATFSTYFLQPVAGVPCAFRCCIEGTPAASAARQSPGLTIDLTRPMGPAAESRHVRMARTGIDEEAQAARAAAKRTRASSAAVATAADEPIGLEPEAPLPPAPTRTIMPDAPAVAQAALLMGTGGADAAYDRLRVQRVVVTSAVGLLLLIGLIVGLVMVLGRTAAINAAAQDATGGAGASAAASPTPGAAAGSAPDVPAGAVDAEGERAPEAPADAGADGTNGAVDIAPPHPAQGGSEPADPRGAPSPATAPGPGPTPSPPAPVAPAEPTPEATATVQPAPSTPTLDPSTVVPASSFVRRVSAAAGSPRSPATRWTVDVGAPARGSVPVFLPSRQMVAAGFVADGASLRFEAKEVATAVVDGGTVRIEAPAAPPSALLSAFDLPSNEEAGPAWDAVLARCTVALRDPAGAEASKAVVGWSRGHRLTVPLALDPGSSRTWDVPDVRGDPVVVIVTETEDNPPSRTERLRGLVRPGEQDSFAVGDLLTVRVDAVEPKAMTCAVQATRSEVLSGVTSEVVADMGRVREIIGRVDEARAPDAGGAMSSEKRDAVRAVWTALRAADVEVVGVPGPDPPADAAGIKAMCDAAAKYFLPIRDALQLRLGTLRANASPIYQIRVLCPNGAVLLEQRVRVKLKGAKG